MTPPASSQPVAIARDIIDGEESTKVLLQKKSGRAKKNLLYVTFVQNTYVLGISLQRAYHIAKYGWIFDGGRDIHLL